MMETRNLPIKNHMIGVKHADYSSHFARAFERSKERRAFGFTLSLSLCVRTCAHVSCFHSLYLSHYACSVPSMIAPSHINTLFCKYVAMYLDTYAHTRLVSVSGDRFGPANALAPAIASAGHSFSPESCRSRPALTCARGAPSTATVSPVFGFKKAAQSQRPAQSSSDTRPNVFAALRVFVVVVVIVVVVPQTVQPNVREHTENSGFRRNVCIVIALRCGSTQ